jgi:hypothetical protein
LDDWGVRPIDLIFMTVNGAEVEALSASFPERRDVRSMYIISAYEREEGSNVDLCRNILKRKGYELHDAGNRKRIIATLGGRAMSPDMRLRFNADALFDYAHWQFETRILVDRGAGEPYNAWDWSFLCEALLNAYRRTGEGRHLDLIRVAVDHAFSQRDFDRGMVDPLHGRARATWGIRHEGEWQTVVTTPGRIVAPALEFIALSEDQGTDWDRAILQKSISAAKEFLPDFVSQGDEGLFSRPARGDWEPLNHAVSFGRALLRLAKLTGDQQYRNIAHQLATFFKRCLVLEDGAYYGWAYRPNMENRRKGFPTNYWKADVDLAFVVDCHRQGLVFDEVDIARFAETLKRGVLRPDFLNCRVTPHKASPVRDRAEKIGARIYGLCGWMVLAEFDSEIERLIEQAMEQHADIMPEGWFGAPHAAFGYSLKQ